jgi:hypothetical protein
VEERAKAPRDAEQRTKIFQRIAITPC